MTMLSYNDSVERSAMVSLSTIMSQESDRMLLNTCDPLRLDKKDMESSKMIRNGERGPSGRV